MTQPLLEVEDLELAFGGVRALDGATLSVPDGGGTVGIIGPNGAGKSTLVNCVTRYYQPSSGKMRFRGDDLIRLRPHELADAGIARTFQNLELFERQSALENVLFGAVAGVRAAGSSTADRRLAQRRSLARAHQQLSDLGLAGAEHSVVGDLPYSQRKRIEFARAMMTEPRLLLLDEPTAGLGDDESAHFAEVIAAATAGQALTVVAIAHDMPFIFGLCERIIVMNEGRVLCEGSPTEIQGSQTVRRVYLGEE